jgi:hypothetical protein
MRLRDETESRFMPAVDFRNTTHIDSARLRSTCLLYAAPYDHQALRVRFRHSRGAPFSGSCYYRDARIFINIGRETRYPFSLATHLAKAQRVPGGWRREVFELAVRDAFQLALFVYLHELYHYLIQRAGRSLRRREAMCDRFAARRLVDDFGCALRRRTGRPVGREEWDFQDLDAFVRPAVRPAPAGEIPVAILRRRDGAGRR